MPKQRGRGRGGRGGRGRQPTRATRARTRQSTSPTDTTLTPSSPSLDQLLQMVRTEVRAELQANQQANRPVQSSQQPAVTTQQSAVTTQQSTLQPTSQPVQSVASSQPGESLFLFCHTYVKLANHYCMWERNDASFPLLVVPMLPIFWHTSVKPANHHCMGDHCMGERERCFVTPLLRMVCIVVPNVISYHIVTPGFFSPTTMHHICGIGNLALQCLCKLA